MNVTNKTINMQRVLSTCLLFLAAIAGHCNVRVPQWDTKDGVKPSPDFEVEVRTSDCNQWTSVPTLSCDVNTAKRSKASFAEFDTDGMVYVRIRSLAQNIDMAQADITVRPKSKNITARVVDKQTVELELQKAEYLSVEFNGDRFHNLHVFANPMLQEHHTPDEPSAIEWRGRNNHDVFVKDARLIYFAPGVHRPKDLPGGDIRIPSNCTVYLAPGAIVKARLIVDHAENVRIVGRGIILNALRGVEITHSRNVLVDGITFLNPQHYTVFGGDSRNIVVRNIKSFSAQSWSDGIDLMCCRNVEIEDIFMRNSDDCIALYNHRWWYWGGTRDIKVKRATLWADVAHPVNIGTHGDDRSNKGETLKNVTIEDCDILYARTNAALCIACGDKNHLSDILFKDIRIEDIYETALFGIHVIFSEKYNRAPGNSINGVIFNNIHFSGDPDLLRPSFVKDYDEEHKIKNVSFQHIYFNGEPADFDHLQRKER